MDARKLTRYVLLTLLLVILVMLLFWYFFLRAKTGDIAETSAGRGLGSATPEAGSVGSTHENNTAAGGFDTGAGSLGEPGVTFPGTRGGAKNPRGVDLPVTGDWTGSSTPPFIPGPAFKTPRLWHIEKGPVAGFGFIKSATTTATLYYVERATGYIFSADAKTGDFVRISNTLQPKVYDALVSNDGAVILRSLDSTGRPVTF